MSAGFTAAEFGGVGVRRLSEQLSNASLVVLAAVIAILLGGLVWSAQRSDQVSIERQQRVARHAMEVALDELALQQETVAIWDESSQNMFAARPDQRWLKDNVTAWLHKIFGHDEAILLDAQGKLVQAGAKGRVADVAHYRRLAPDVAHLVQAVRGESRASAGVHDRLPGQGLVRGATVRTTPRTIHDTHMILLGGRPAAVSAMLMKPSTPGYVGYREQWPVLISARYLDAGFMAELDAKYLLHRPHFSRSDKVGEGEHAVPIDTRTGERLGYLIWTPELPGSRIMANLLPLYVAAILLLALLTGMLLVRLRSSLKERGLLEERAQWLAFRDPLTGLPNRTRLSDELAAALKEQGASGEPVSLLLIDLDRFKQVNDTLGHIAGDEMIAEFARRIVAAVEPPATVARLGGDEFAIVLPGRSADEAMAVSEIVLSLFARPFDLGSQQLYGGASIGAVTLCGDVPAIEAMRRADVALYRAKGAGRHCARLYAPTMDAATQQRIQVERELREAIGAGEFSLWSQPLVRPDGVPVGQEMLLRWDHPSLGTVSPEKIIPVAEESGLIHPIGDWVLREAVGVAARSHRSLFTAVNLSPVQLRDERFVDQALALCRAAGVDPGSIELEITERVLMEDNGTVQESLRRLREGGFRLALDDFGTGYSSLSYLRQFTVDKIKIDRSFVADVCGSADSRAIVAAIISLGQALGLTIAAEGVETEQQADLLRMAGCDQLQGHLFAQPARVVKPAPLPKVDGRAVRSGEGL